MSEVKINIDYVQFMIDEGNIKLERKFMQEIAAQDLINAGKKKKN